MKEYAYIEKPGPESFLNNFIADTLLIAKNIVILRKIRHLDRVSAVFAMSIKRVDKLDFSLFPRSLYGSGVEKHTCEKSCLYQFSYSCNSLIL